MQEARIMGRIMLTNQHQRVNLPIPHNLDKYVHLHALHPLHARMCYGHASHQSVWGPATTDGLPRANQSTCHQIACDIQYPGNPMDSGKRETTIKVPYGMSNSRPIGAILG